MATLTIRNLDDPLKVALRVRAAHNGRSMEEEARQILKAILSTPPASRNLFDVVREHFAPIDGFELDTGELRREPMPDHKLFD